MQTLLWLVKRACTHSYATRAQLIEWHAQRALSEL